MQALARKYRPKNFASVAVQSHVSNTLRGAIARNRVAHGYLLCGPRGTGKTTLARVLAMALNCERRSEDGEPCGECSSCQRIWSGSASLDVVEIDAASNRGVDDARELRERAMYAPTGDDRYKVYIVDEAHMLTREAWNALLKILEEPPPRVVFVFATTEPQKIAQFASPVLSRLQRFDLKRIGAAEIRERLGEVLAAEKVKAEPEALAMIARAADGGLRDALSLADQVISLGEGEVTVAGVRDALGLVPEDEYLAALDLVAERRAADVFPLVARLADHGADFGVFLAGFGDVLRAQLAIALGGEAPDVSERLRQALTERRSALGASDLLRMLTAITELEPRFRRSGQQQLLIETLLVRFALLDRTVTIESLLNEMGGSGSSGSGGSGGGGAKPGGASGGGGRASGQVSAPQSSAPPISSPRSSPGRTTASAADRTTTPSSIAPSASLHAAAASAPTAAIAVDRAEPRRSASDALELNTLAERWDDVATKLRTDGKAILASALEHMIPVAVTSRGDVTVQLEESNDIYARAFESGRRDVIAALAGFFTGVRDVQLRAPDAPARSHKRLTAESLREETIATLRRRDPVLGEAIDALDLELLD